MRWIDCQQNQSSHTIQKLKQSYILIYSKYMHNSKKYANATSINPQLLNSKKIPKSKSPSPRRSTSPQDWAQRYRQLHQQYKKIEQQTKNRKHLYEMQEKEIVRLRKQKVRDQEEINRLRSILGFIKKQDRGIQCEVQSSNEEQFFKKKSRVVYQHQNKYNDHLMSFTETCTSHTNLPSRKKSRSPEYQKFRYNFSPKNLQFRKNSQKSDESISRKQSRNKKNKEKLEIQLKQRMRTESLYNETDRYLDLFKKQKKQSTFYALSPKNNGFLDANETGTKSKLLNLTSKQKMSKLSNSPYSKHKFLESIRYNIE